MLIGSVASAISATLMNASSTLYSSFADVSKYGMFPFDSHHSLAVLSDT